MANGLIPRQWVEMRSSGLVWLVWLVLVVSLRLTLSSSFSFCFVQFITLFQKLKIILAVPLKANVWNFRVWRALSLSYFVFHMYAIVLHRPFRPALPRDTWIQSTDNLWHDVVSAPLEIVGYLCFRFQMLKTMELLCISEEDPSWWAQTCVGLVIHFTWKAIYNVYFHPLSKFPGPKAAAATPIPYVRRLLNGRFVDWTLSLHPQYGEIVRISPDELSFVTPAAWQDIFAHRPPLPKPAVGVLPSANDVPSFGQTNNTADHNRMRKVLNPAFSERALKAQEYILQSYTDLLITRLRDQINSAGTGSTAVDVNAWYNYTTFDTIGDLCFGESFSSLENSEQHPWVQAIFQGVKFGMLTTAFDYFGAKSLVRRLLPKSLNAKARLHAEFTSHKIDRRIRNKSARPDIMSFILDHNEKTGMSREELDSTGAFLVFAGSETSAGTCATSTWFVLKNPHVMRRLRQEIESRFASPEDITLSAMPDLPYLHAVILEAMRLQPVGPVSVPREVDRPGTVICGHEIPVGVSDICYQKKFLSSLPFFWLFFFEWYKSENEAETKSLDAGWNSTKNRLSTSTEFCRATFVPSGALAQRCRSQICGRSKSHVWTFHSRAPELYWTTVRILLMFQIRNRNHWLDSPTAWPGRKWNWFSARCFGISIWPSKKTTQKTGQIRRFLSRMSGYLWTSGLVFEHDGSLNECFGRLSISFFISRESFKGEEDPDILQHIVVYTRSNYPYTTWQNWIPSLGDFSYRQSFINYTHPVW